MGKLLLNTVSLSMIMFFLTTSCSEVKNKETDLKNKVNSEQHKAAFINTMQKHLAAVTNRDLEALKSTMSPNGDMQLILPSTEIINKVDGFMKYHEDWFSDPSWTFETKILNTEIGDFMGMAIVEIMYREADRDGVPYFNRMIVSYDLQKINEHWYIIKDHASSVEKSTDIK